MHGTYTANMAIYESDLLISIGARFDDRVTGNLKHFAPNAKLLTLTSTQRKLERMFQPRFQLLEMQKKY